MIDLRTIVPLDVETIAQSVAKTGHLLVVDEAFAMCGIGAEIAAAMMEHAFDDLDAPVGRIHTDPTAHPFSPAHEGAVIITTERVVDGAKAVSGRQADHSAPAARRAIEGRRRPLRRALRPAPAAAGSTQPPAQPSRQQRPIGQSRPPRPAWR